MSNKNKFNVTIIDDDALMREMLGDYFNTHFPDSSITNFISGEDALEKDLNTQQLIVLDYHLSANTPGSMNGIQVLSQLNGRYSGLPVIVISGQENPEIAANTLKQRAWDYIIKNDNTFNRLGIEVSKLMDRTVMLDENSTRSKIVRMSVLLATVIFIVLLASKFF